MIDSGSPISIFTQADLRKLLRIDVKFPIPLPMNERYMDYKTQPLNRVGFINVEVQVGKRKIKTQELSKREMGNYQYLGETGWHN